MATFTKELRQQIVEDFARRHNGLYDPALFLQEVKDAGKEHPAHSWFTWNDIDAAAAHRLDQARDFARGLKVVFRIEQVTGPSQVRVHQVEAPLVHSPREGRKDGGGYRLTVPTLDDHLHELAGQAADDLRAWAARYKAPLTAAGIADGKIEAIIAKLELLAEDRKSA